MRLTVVVLLAFLVLGSAYAFPIGGISSCGTYSTPNVNYFLTGPLSTSGTCIILQAENSTFNCRGYNITGDGTGAGIVVQDANNMTVGNCTVQDFSDGVDYYNTMNDTLTNSSISANDGNGIYLQSPSGSVSVLNTSVTTNGSQAINDYYSNGNAFANVQASSPEGDYGVYLYSAYNNTFTNVNASSGDEYGVYAYDSSNNTFTNLNASSDYYGVYLDYSEYNTLTGVNASSTSNDFIGAYFHESNNNTISGSRLSSPGKYGVYYYYSSYNTVANSTISSTTSTPVYIYYDCNYNTFANNTFISVSGNSGELVFIYYDSYYNVFYLNNFTQTDQYYVYNPWENNYLNATVDGKNQGNIYANVMDGTDPVSGSVPSSISGMYIGTDGAVPYDYDSSGYRVYGDTDYAPLTASTDNTSICHVLDTPNSVYNLTRDMHGLAGNSNGPSCLDVEADNVTVDCSGHSIIGPSNSGFYQYYNPVGDGVYSDSFNTTVENCNMKDLYYGIDFEYNENGTITQNNLSNNYDGFYLYYSDYDSVLNNSMDGDQNGFGVWYSNYNQIGLNTINNALLSNYYDEESSCPFLYSWNGTGYGMVTDISAESGILGVNLGNGTYKKSIPGDYAKISSDQLDEANGTYDMQVTEEYDEISYLDQVALVTVDHSPAFDVYPGLLRSDLGKIYTVGKSLTAPISCIDGNGKNCLAQVSAQDGYYALAENDTMNNLTLDFGNVSANDMKLVLTGFSTFGNGSSNTRLVQVKNAQGKWVTVYSNSDIKRPSGLPRTYVINLTGKVNTSDVSVKLGFVRSSFDYVALDTSPQQNFTVNTYSPESADLHWRGYSNYSGGVVPQYDYNSVINDTLYSNPTGDFTKYGDVTPLLASVDDEYVIMRHGDEISAQFPYVAMQNSSDVRDFLFYSYDYYKPASNVYGGTVDPLPFKNMSNYPYQSNESYPSDAAHTAYLSTWDTRNYTHGSPALAGGSLPYSSGNVVFNNSITGASSSIGLYLYEESDTQLLDNGISGVTWGVYTDDDSGDLISGNTISQAVNGISLTDGAHSDTILGNSVSTAGTASAFDYPQDVAYGPDGYVYVSDEDNRVIERVNTTTSETDVVAGQPQAYGYQEGIGSGALFRYPMALAFGPDGYLYVSDYCAIRKINVTTNETFLVAGNTGSCGYQDGNGSSAEFDWPRGFVSGPDGYLYVADSDNTVIRKINVTTNETSLVAGTPDSWGYVENDTNGSYARFSYPEALTFGPDGYLYVADSENGVIRRINITTTGTYYVTGSPQSNCGYAEGVNTSASFCYPYGLAFGQDGFLYISDSSNSLIRKVNVDTGQTYFVAGNLSTYYQEGIGSGASFHYPEGLSAGPGNTVYIADTDNNRVRSINTVTDQTSLVAGTGYQGFLYDYDRSALLLQDTGDNLVANNTFESQMPVVNLQDAGDNLFVNNTLSSPSSDLLTLDSDSGENTFYWNTFVDTPGLYVNDSNGGNAYDATTPSDTDEGNIWANVINGQVVVAGTNLSTGFPQYFIGSEGSGYPYDDADSLGKTVGVTDYAPLTQSGTLPPPAPTNTGPTSTSSATNLKSTTWTEQFDCTSGQVTLTAADGASGLDVRLIGTSNGYSDTERSDQYGNAIFTITATGTYKVYQPTSSDYKSYTSDPFDLALCPTNSTPPYVPPQQNNNGTQNVTTNTTGQTTNTTAPANVTPSGPTQQDASDAISAATAAISNAEQAGKDTSSANTLLGEANAALAAGNYTGAMQFANEAEQAALNAAGAPTSAPQAPASSSVSAPAPAPPGTNWLLFGTILLVVIVVIGGIIFMMPKPRASKKK